MNCWNSKLYYTILGSFEQWKRNASEPRVILLYDDIYPYTANDQVLLYSLDHHWFYSMFFM